ncbi:hypothetical protein ACFL2T_07090, partial [Elusimicrobiota bacterium]
MRRPGPRGWTLATAAVVVCCVPAVPAVAAPSIAVSGYVKNLYRYSRSPLGDEPYWVDLTRARVKLDAKLPLAQPAGDPGSPRRSVRVHLEYDHELRAGTYFDTLDYELFGLAEPQSYLTMEQAISTGTDAHYRHLLYRGWVELRSGPWRARFGRQRIAWGTGKLWNPTDFLNPYRPVSLEREERRGVDSASVRRGIGALGRGEAVYTLADRWPGSDLLGRVSGNAANTDISLSGGKVAGSTSSWTIG